MNRRSPPSSLPLAKAEPMIEASTSSDININVDTDAIVQDTQIWLEKAVIGLNLCPFAKAVHHKKQIRYVVSTAQDRDALAEVLKRELRLLDTTDANQTDTTLLIHPCVLLDFFDYSAFLAQADRIVAALGLDGVLQLASFHPEYVFADSPTSAIENYTNRSPYPMLHLLRESSIERAVEAFPEAALVYERNIATLRCLGKLGWDALHIPSGRLNKID